MSKHLIGNVKQKISQNISHILVFDLQWSLVMGLTEVDGPSPRSQVKNFNPQTKRAGGSPGSS